MYAIHVWWSVLASNLENAHLHVPGNQASNAPSSLSAFLGTITAIERLDCNLTSMLILASLYLPRLPPGVPKDHSQQAAHPTMS